MFLYDMRRQLMGNNIVGHVLADLYVACFSWGIEQWIKKKTEEEFLGSL